MADDRHEAYRAMFTRTYIREVLENIEDKQAIASIMYDAIEIALSSNYTDTWPRPTVKKVMQEALENNKRMI